MNKFSKWIRTAGPTARFVYHTGTSLKECDAETLRLVRTGSDLGYVLLTQKRIPSPDKSGLFEYTVTRRSSIVPHEYFSKVEFDGE